jgi:hypothetical protein
MTFDEWFVKYPLPAEIDTMDDTDREQWTWALRSAYKTGAASTREWVGLTEPELHEINPTWPAPNEHWKYQDVLAFVRAIEAKLKEKNT